MLQNILKREGLETNLFGIGNDGHSCCYGKRFQVRNSLTAAVAGTKRRTGFCVIFVVMRPCLGDKRLVSRHAIRHVCAGHTGKKK